MSQTGRFSLRKGFRWYRQAVAELRQQVDSGLLGGFGAEMVCLLEAYPASKDSFEELTCTKVGQGLSKKAAWDKVDRDEALFQMALLIASKETHLSTEEIGNRVALKLSPGTETRMPKNTHQAGTIKYYKWIAVNKNAGNALGASAIKQILRSFEAEYGDSLQDLARSFVVGLR